MRIVSINIPQSTLELDGLEEVSMGKLGQIVILAGKNGSGKTRILDKISKYLTKKPTKRALKEKKNNIEKYEEEILKATADVARLMGISAKEAVKTNRFANNAKIAGVQQKLNLLKAEQPWEYVETDTLSDNYQLVRFVPKSIQLTDSNKILPSDLIGQSKLIDSPGVDRLPKSAIAKMQFVQNRWFNSSHQVFSGKPAEAEQAKADYLRLQDILRIFLDTEIDRTIDGEVMLFGLPISKANLSDGQKIILQFCMAIYSQEANLKDIILVMDEPENHLHPSVIIDLIERIIKCVPKGQIWISTHSVPLLAHFNPNSIWYVDKGKVTHSGKIPEKVLESLLGDESRIAKLQDFIGLPAHYASNQYAFECLFEPIAVETEIDDPQPLQIRTSLIGHQKGKKIKVLDFGSGKGRIVTNIMEIDAKVGVKSLSEKIDYHAFDEDTKDKDICVNAIVRAYGDDKKRYYNKHEKILEEHGKESFDVVIMCNVLHEIDPLQWLDLFKPEGKVSTLLKKDGILLLVEDHQIPVGEKAYQKGFLVLDSVQIKEIFQIPSPSKGFEIHDARNDGRLKAHSIPKKYLVKINPNTRLNAIKDLKRLAREKILELRNQTQRDYRKGKEHGFWTQQYANAELCISQLEV